MNVFVYEVGDGLYVNLTNRCPCACRFCIRTKSDGAYGSDSLWLDREPAAAEVCAEIDRRLSGHRELVFCGFGEPTERLDTLLEVADGVRARHPGLPIRVNTNGLSDLIAGEPTAARFAGRVDTLSVSLNAATAEEYLELCRPKFGLGSYAAMLDFVRAARNHVPNVVLSVVRTPELTPEKESACRAIADGLGLPLRIRTFVA